METRSVLMRLTVLLAAVILVGCAPSAAQPTSAGVVAPTPVMTQVRQTVESTVVPTEKPPDAKPQADLPACTKPDGYRQRDGLEFAFVITDAIGPAYFWVKFDSETSKIFVKAGSEEGKYTEEYELDYCEMDEYNCYHSAILTVDKITRFGMDYVVCGDKVYTKFGIFNY